MPYRKAQNLGLLPLMSLKTQGMPASTSAGARTRGASISPILGGVGAGLATQQPGEDIWAALTRGLMQGLAMRDNTVRDAREQEQHDAQMKALQMQMSGAQQDRGFQTAQRNAMMTELFPGQFDANTGILFNKPRPPLNAPLPPPVTQERLPNITSQGGAGRPPINAPEQIPTTVPLGAPDRSMQGIDGPVQTYVDPDDGKTYQLLPGRDPADPQSWVVLY